MEEMEQFKAVQNKRRAGQDIRKMKGFMRQHTRLKKKNEEINT